MKTIDIPIDDDTFSKAEQKAAALSTSLPDVVARYLRQWSDGEAAQAEVRRKMIAMFAKPTWQFGVGAPDSREQRNARR
jgi:hypothetical protein